MQNDAMVLEHAGRVSDLLARPTVAGLEELLKAQYALRIGLKDSLPEPCFLAISDMQGTYRLGLSDAECRQFKIYVVGGAVRDRLQKRLQSVDIDCVIAAECWDEFLAHAESAGYRPRLVERAYSCKLQAGPAAGREFVATRRDFYAPGGKLVQAEPASMQQDPWRRDFTLQAIYADPMNGDIWDPFNALAARRLKAVLPGTLVEDPLRVIRLLRAHFVHRLEIEPATETEAVRVAACPELTSQVEPFRIRAEFDRAARGGVLGPMLRQLAQWRWSGIPAAHQELDALVARSATQWLRKAGLSLGFV